MRKQTNRRHFLAFGVSFGRLTVGSGAAIGLASCGGGGGGGDMDSKVPTANLDLCELASGANSLGKNDLSIGKTAPRIAVRAAPHSGFSWFTRDFTIVACNGPGKTELHEDLFDVFMGKFQSSMTGSVVYVDGLNGRDVNSGCSWATAFQTIEMAVRSSNGNIIYVAPGYYTTWRGFRFTDRLGSQPKALIAPKGGVTIAYSGDDLKNASWSSTTGYQNTYSTKISTGNWVTRVLDANSVDELNLPKPIPKQSSIAAVDSSGYGWWYDKISRILYLRIQAQDVNVLKSNLTGIYATDGDNQYRITAAVLYIENIILFGYPSLYNDVGQLTPEIWLKNVSVRYSEGHSRSINGGKCYSQGGTYYRSAADNANYSALNGVVAYGVEINDLTWYAGDVDTFGAGASQPNNPVSTEQDKNGSSIHEGYVVRINGSHNKSFGPPIADTTSSFTWCIGTQTGSTFDFYSNGLPYGFVMQGNNAWLDSCQAGMASDATLNSDFGANTRLFNCLGLEVASRSGIFSIYAPG